jgi:hypothetical protein
MALPPKAALTAAAMFCAILTGKLAATVSGSPEPDALLYRDEPPKVAIIVQVTRSLYAWLSRFFALGATLSFEGRLQARRIASTLPVSVEPNNARA